MKKLVALRGAVQVQNEIEDIAARVAELYGGLLAANGLAEGDLVSLEFSVTPDIDALNPATALRKSGRAAHLPLMVFQEAVFPGMLPRVIRALLYAYADEGREARHLYLNGAEVLRPDRTKD